MSGSLFITNMSCRLSCELPVVFTAWLSGCSWLLCSSIAPGLLLVVRGPASTRRHIPARPQFALAARREHPLPSFHSNVTYSFGRFCRRCHWTTEYRTFCAVRRDVTSVTNGISYKKQLFRVCKSVHHYTFKQINQPDASISQIYCSSFKYSSTCFRHLHVHHQELINCSSRLRFTVGTW
jgi:hypothetical protein